jgi:hypothetical protein
MSLSPECSCCHEAGHAVAWVVNGDQLLLVVGRADANLTPEQESLRDESIIGAGGSTVDVINQLIRARHSGGATIRRRARSSCKDCKNSVFTETCPACMKTLTQHLACIFAGGRCDSPFIAGPTGRESDRRRSRPNRRPPWIDVFRWVRVLPEEPFLSMA